jgi:GMP synthase-like glutamine amidotransferase
MKGQDHSAHRKSANDGHGAHAGSMKVQVLQHVPSEGLGSIAAWLSERDAIVHYTRFYQSAVLPDPGSIDLVIAMGGPMSVNDERDYPWLKQEKAFIKEAVDRGLAVLGVCLGAQIIANALGARVFANAHKEIGWFPVQAVSTGSDTFRFPPLTSVFHWHGETFDLPPGAVRLASSAGCKNQAFQIGRTVIGLQFHLEATPATADQLIQHCRDELVADEYVQTEQALLSASHDAYRGINRLMNDVLSYITRFHTAANP